MNKITRVLTMSGIGLVAAVMMAGPAQASGTAAQADSKSSASQSSKAQQHRDREYVAGYFSSRRDCQIEGIKGRWIGRWDRFDCDFLRLGLRGGTWRLEVERDWRDNGFGIGNRGHDYRDNGFRTGNRGHDYRDSHKGTHHSKHDQHNNGSKGGKNGRR
jgi:hypothetical protein